MSSPRKITCVGLCTLDVLQYYTERPSWGGKGVASETLVDAGGPATNAAVTVSLLGGRAALVTAIGQGAEARLAHERLAPYELEIYDCADAGGALPLSSIWVDERRGERTVLSTNRVSSLAAPSSAALDDSAAVLIDGHHPELALAMARAARERGVPIVLDGGSWRPVFRNLLSLADVAIVSETFRPPGTEARGLDLARRIRDQWGTPCVAVTHGAGDVVGVDGDREGRTPVPAGEVVDTLGAGDVLHGAYAWFRYGEGWPHDRALADACAVASASCTHRGTRKGVRMFGRRPLTTE